MSKVSIAIITPSLGNGGTERVSSLLSIFLTDLGYDVTIFAAYPNKDYPFKGTYVHLGHSKKKSSSFLLLARSFQKLYKSVKNGNFDFVIDFRSRRIFWIEFMFHLFIYTAVKRVILTIHLPLIDKYIPRPWFIFKPIYKRTFALVSVSDAISNMLQNQGYTNVSVIKNPLDFTRINRLEREQTMIEFPYVIAAGRMDDNIKRFDHLIEAYAASNLPENGVHLIILGDGEVKHNLMATTDKLECSHMIHFEGFQQNPFKYFVNAQFFILASEFEGFPMVLIEALACGTPVVSYDCPTGPSEIIQHEQNGLLVENGSIEALTTAISRMHEDKALYKTCQINAKKSVEHLSFENIKDQWRQLIESVTP